MERVTKNDKIKFASDLLRNYRIINGHVNVLSKKINIARNTLNCGDGLSTVALGTIGSSNISNIVESVVIREIEKIEKMEFEKMIYKNIRDGIKEAIDSLRGDERKVIYLYYLTDIKLSWKEIGRLIATSEDNARGYIREKALINIYETIKGIEEIKTLHNISR